jgi:AAHS family 4-hydroxybenzoate transporter-like MFS transporter
MSGATARDVDTLVDGQQFRGFNLALLIWSFLATLSDGFELSALGFAVPHISEEWHVAPGDMGWMLSASLFGMFFGAPLFGAIGDRYGRRPAIVIGCLAFGITTLAIAGAHSIGQITVLRFIAGLGMGGLLPNTIALSSELSPRRLRARLVILMFMGITLGSSLPGLIAAWVVPAHGWQAIFVIGGVGATLIGILLAFALPESVKLLAMREGRREELLRTLRRMRPDVALGDDVTLTLVTARPHQASARALFAGGLAPFTLLIWVCFATTLMANFFLANWLPQLFKQMGVSAEDAALTATMYHFGATLGGLAMSLILDRIGFLAIGSLLLVAVPAMVGIGAPGLSPVMLGLLVAFAGFCVLGAQFGSNAAAGLIYPTGCRSRGLGLAFGIGRVGSVLGPLLGAHLIGSSLPVTTMLAAMAAPVLLGALAALVLAVLSRRKIASWGLDEVPPNPIE